VAEQADRRIKGASSARAWGRALTPAQLREAERGLRQILARKFSARWIANNHRDLLAQANAEYVEWLEDNEPARNPVGWILNCAYWRAQNLLDAETRRPRPAPLDSVFHVPDESTPDPEQQVLERDRTHRLAEALSRLPEKEQRLLALVYYDGHSIREAGRKLGWRKSAADRHHAAAMEKMFALVGDRKLLSPALLGVFAREEISGQGTLAGFWNVLATPVRGAWAAVTETAELTVQRGAIEVGQRIAPFTDAAAGTTATSGASRALAQCAAAAGIAVCGALAAPPIESGVDELFIRADPTRSRPARSSAAPREPAPSSSTSASESSAAPASGPVRAREGGQEPRQAERRRKDRPRPTRLRRATAPPVAPAPVEPPPEPPPAEIEEESAPPPAPAEPPPATGGQASQEFGL
jgi:RNA polymerase sigma factor (sigma-70 family)